MDDPKLDRTSELRNVTVLGDHRVKFRMLGKTVYDNRDVVAVVTDNRHRSLEAVDFRGKKYVVDALGLSQLHTDDQVMLRTALPVYDALYAWCRYAQGETHHWNPDLLKGVRP